jgi:branched-chain amino acid transport system ATP-binding protein
LIRTVRDRLGITVLLVEHHIGLVMSLSDQVVVLNFGRVIADGPPEAVRNSPAVTEAYLGPRH